MTPPINSARRAKENAIHLQQVFQHIDGRCVLSNIALRIPRGRVFLLLGPNGAGKTLLMHLLTGLHQPSVGTIEILGQPINQLSATRRAALRRDIGMVFQHGSLIGDLNILDNILLPLRCEALQRSEMARRARLIMTRLHLDGMENLYPDALSGGLLKQVELARALIHRPQLLIWDEILDSVDAASAHEVLNLIKNERTLGNMTLILTSHRQSLMTELAEQIGILERGRLLFQGSPGQVLAASASQPRLHTLLNPA